MNPAAKPRTKSSLNPMSEKEVSETAKPSANSIAKDTRALSSHSLHDQLVRTEKVTFESYLRLSAYDVIENDRTKQKS
jgi:hypothetical protein